VEDVGAVSFDERGANQSEHRCAGEEPDAAGKFSQVLSYKYSEPPALAIRYPDVKLSQPSPTLHV